jgi:FtsZ-binding cell division protein ZapB
MGEGIDRFLRAAGAEGIHERCGYTQRRLRDYEEGRGMDSGTISVDEFQALEQKVLQTVELIKREREARTAAEAGKAVAEAEIVVLREELEKARIEGGTLQHEVETLKQELAEKGDVQAQNESLHKETEGLMREREAVRLRVEKMLATMDELL